MFYRPDVLAKYGWTIPTTRAELEDLCTEAAKAGLVPLAGGSADWHPAVERWMTMWWNHYNGPQAFYKALTGDVPWTDPAIVDRGGAAQELLRQGLDSRRGAEVLH
jgi:raffinose/stachyose/melibiose transport system substrate-binding protein